MVLGGYQDLPLVDRRIAEVRSGVPDEVPKEVLFEVGFRVRSFGAAELVQAGKKWPAGVRVAPINSAVPPPSSPGVRLGGRDLVDEVAQTGDDDFGNRHVAGM
jgi:hypothetical protein